MTEGVLQQHTRRGLDWSFPSERGIQLLAAALCVVLVLAPLVPLVLQSFIDRPLYDAGWQFGFGGYRALFTSSEAARVIGNTLYFAILSSALSLVFGIGAAIILGRTDIPLPGTILALTNWPFYISAIVLAIGWMIVYGPNGYITIMVRNAGLPTWNLYSLEGMALVSAVSHAPVTLLYAIGSVRQQDSALENAALVSGAGPLRIISKITLPLMRPAIIFCVIMNLVVSLEAFAIPLVLGGPNGIDLITSFIYRSGFSAIKPNYPLVSAAAVCLLLVVTVMTVLQLFLLRKMDRFTTVGAKASRQNKFELGAARWPVFVASIVYLLLFIVIPLSGVFLRSITSFLTPLVPISETLTMGNYHAIFSERSYVNAIWNTLIIAVFGGALSTVVIALFVFVAQRSNFWGRQALDFLAQYPRAIPGVLVGLGLFYATALVPGLAGLMGTLWILVIAYTIRFLPSGYSIIAPAVMQLSRDFDRAANSMGANWLTVCARIVAPLAKASILNCYAILFVLSIKEYASAVFLFRQGTEVMGTVMLSFWSQGDSGPVAALAVLQILVVSLFVLVLGRVFGGRLHG